MNRLIYSKITLFSIRKYSSHIKSLIEISPEIQSALKSKSPIVALESTIITHGMPYPQNVQTALEVEGIVREKHAIPATIAILNGKIKIGLSNEDINELGKNTNSQAIKTSRRDMCYVVSKGLNGGTTVSGTIICAKLAGIDIFATGGIGGVHRNVEQTMDISADLIELGRNSITVVSSGVKSILDIPKTLEYLETYGVTVATYQSPEKDFPAFYTRKSGSKSPYNVDDATEAANLIMKSKMLNLNSGILIAVPVPERDAMDDRVINTAIEEALKKAKLNGISGKEATPFLLKEVGKMTANKSLSTNISLIKNNAEVAAEISVEMYKMSNNFYVGSKKSEKNGYSPVVIGGSMLDLCCTAKVSKIELNGATYNAAFETFGGGVGRNIAEGISKLYGNVEFISKVGYDGNGDFLIDLLPTNCQRAIEKEPNHQTASCIIILDGMGDSKLILANMDIHKTIDSTMIKRYESLISSAPIVVFDANLSLDAIATILELCEMYDKPAFFEPTDLNFATKPFQLPKNLMQQIKFISPNIYELNEIGKIFGCDCIFNSNESEVNQLLNYPWFIENIKNVSNVITNHVDNIIITLGANGVVIARKHTTNDMTFFNNRCEYIKSLERNKTQYRFYNVEKLKTKIVNVSGAGDSFDVGFITGIVKELPEDISISVGMECAKAALMSKSAVPNSYFSENHQCWHQNAIYKDI